jgi:glycosyltransferase involved in cell wall biosynthesis
LSGPSAQTSGARPTIAACVICRNEGDKLVGCLESVSWADERLVVDLESEDDTASVAERLGARVVRHEVVPIVEPLRNVAADAVGSDWVLALDPDERVEPGLARELRALSVRNDIDVIVIPFMNYDLGFPPSQPLHRYNPIPRMYRRDRIRWPEKPHALPAFDPSRTYRIPSRDELVMRHERSRNLPEILDRAIRYAPAQAQAMIDDGEVFMARRMVRALAEKTYKQFVAGRPYQDGVPGLLRATVLVHYHFCVWLELWQRSGIGRTAEDDRYVAKIGKAVSAFDRAQRLARAPLKAARRLRSCRSHPLDPRP